MKYKIEQNGQFLGHHMGNTPKEAVNKMLTTLYGKCYSINKHGTFDLTTGRNHYHITGEE